MKIFFEDLAEDPADSRHADLQQDLAMSAAFLPPLLRSAAGIAFPHYVVHQDRH